MTKETRKQNKEVERIRKSIRKAVSKGVSTAVVSATVEDAMADKGGAKASAPATAKAANLPVGTKSTDVTFKRGVTAPPTKSSGKPAILNKKPMVPDSKRPSPKELPGKKKPTTLSLKSDEES
jgi:hypothetical protein